MHRGVCMYVYVDADDVEGLVSFFALSGVMEMGSLGDDRKNFFKMGVIGFGRETDNFPDVSSMTTLFLSLLSPLSSFNETKKFRILSILMKTKGKKRKEKKRKEKKRKEKSKETRFVLTV